MTIRLWDQQSIMPGKARQGKARQGKARQGKARQGKARQGKASRRFDNLMAGMPSSGMQQKMQNSSNITHQRSLRAADVAVHTRQRKAVTGVCCRECTGPCT